MENIVVLFAGFELGRSVRNRYLGSSAIRLCVEWGARHSSSRTFILSTKGNTDTIFSLISSSEALSSVEFVERDFWDARTVASCVSECCEKAGAKCALFAFIDQPFMSDSLAGKMLGVHADNLAEYTFADGFPGGIAGEVIDSGAASLIASLAEGKEIPASRTMFMDIMKGDINSFEIETVLSEVDFRRYRLLFESSSAGGEASCAALCPVLPGSFREGRAEDIGLAALSCADSVRTLPFFFDVQITSRSNHVTLCSPPPALGVGGFPDMDIGKFRALVRAASEMNPDAVFSLSCFGEPLLHPSFIDFARAVLSENLRLLVETDGILVGGLAEKIRGLSEFRDRMDWIVDIDAAGAKTYAAVRNAPEGDFEKAVGAVSVLSGMFPSRVYPQFTRMDANEHELESFFRFWKDSSSPSGGKVIIKKFDSLCASLPDRKPADLSPLVRNACWHLARDFVVLADGSVVPCRGCGASACAGNAFSEDIGEIWARGKELFAEHLSGKFRGRCGGCNEYYTFNF